MTTWEERMSLKAKARNHAEQVAEYIPEGHEEHHVHHVLSGTECSCGVFLGLCCFVVPTSADEWIEWNGGNPDPRLCDICGQVLDDPSWYGGLDDD